MNKPTHSKKTISLNEIPEISFKTNKQETAKGQVNAFGMGEGLAYNIKHLKPGFPKKKYLLKLEQ